MSRSNRSDRRRRRPHRQPETEQSAPTPQREVQAPPPEPAAFHTSFPPEPLPAVRSEPRARAAAARVADADDELGGELRAGCPMLTRTKMALRGLDDRHVPRCSLAWAIHSEAEAAFCLLTEDLVDCWKAHPERVPALESLVSGEATAAD